MYQMDGHQPMNVVKILSFRRLRHKREFHFTDTRIETYGFHNFLAKWFKIGKHKKPKANGYFEHSTILIRYSGNYNDYNRFAFSSSAKRDREFAKLEKFIADLQAGLI